MNSNAGQMAEGPKLPSLAELFDPSTRAEGYEEWVAACIAVYERDTDDTMRTVLRFFEALREDLSPDDLRQIRTYLVSDFGKGVEAMFAAQGVSS